MDFDKLLERDRALGLQRLRQPVLHRASGSACIPAPTSRSRPATRATTCWRTRRPPTWPRARAALGIAAGPDGGALRAHAPRVRGRLRAECSTSRGWSPRCGPRARRARAAHYFYDADPLGASCTARAHARRGFAHPSVEELCLAADVLLTDYSSIMFDYAVLDRPIVIHAPDWDDLPRAAAGRTSTCSPSRPGRSPAPQDEVVAALRERPGRPARAAFRERFCALDDGGAAERVVQRVCRGSHEAARPRRRRRPQRHEPAAGILGQLGFHIPQPEVQADDTNPRGFGEPRWVVDFHSRDPAPQARHGQRLAPRRLGADGGRRPSRDRPGASCASGWRGELEPADDDRGQGPAHGLVPAAWRGLRARSSARGPRS